MTAVLFSSAGRRVELLNCFRRDAQALNLPLRILAVDVAPEFSAACRLADASFPVPRCTAEDFIPALLEICRRESVQLVVPTIDTEVQVLAENRERFTAIGTHVSVSDPDIVRIARDKFRSSAFLEQAGLPTPRSGSVQAVSNQPAAWRWPLILKPAAGSSSIGIQLARDIDQFRVLASQRADFVAQEFWEGREYTVNIFFDRSGRLRCAIPHFRKETRAGEVSKGITARHPLLMEYAAKLDAALKGARGALCFQAIINDQGEGAIFEINARFGGGYPLAHQAGATFSKWLLEEVAGRAISANNDWRDGVMMLRYDAAIFSEAGV
jgi:carbamoyl-phosphate synthase large subunit